MNYKIEKLDHQGRGIAFIDDKITFIENALPGEIVEINIFNHKRKFNEAVVTKYIKESEDRVVPICKYYNECGGCDLMHLSYEKQLEYKNQKVKEILHKFAKIDLDFDIVPSSKEFGYRDKITLKVESNKIGYYMRKTNSIIPITECKLACSEINDLLEDLLKIKDFKSCYELTIRNVNSDKTALTFYLRNEKDVIDFAKENVIVNYIYNRESKKVDNESKIIAKINDLQFLVSPEAFFQINIDQTIEIYNKVIEYLEPKSTDSVLDLYCGSGTIGIYAAKVANKVVGVEICKPAIEDANCNKKLNNISNIEFICGDSETVIRKMDTYFDSIIVDPPRNGLTSDVIKDILRLKPKRIVYVSCDPITLARDLNIFKDKYEINEIKPYDMFPNTYHVENIAKLSLKN